MLLLRQIAGRASSIESYEESLRAGQGSILGKKSRERYEHHCFLIITQSISVSWKLLSRQTGNKADTTKLAR